MLTRTCVVVALITALTLAAGAFGEESPQLNLQLKARTGGELSGQLLDYNDHGLVILNGETPYVFAWTELDGGSAYNARRNIVLAERGGISRLNADDQFKLGLFALLQERIDLAKNAFDTAAKLDARYRRRGENAMAEHRRRREDAARGLGFDPLPPKGNGRSPDADPEPAADEDSPGPAERVALDGDSQGSSVAKVWEALPERADEAEVGVRVRAAYLTFGEKVRELLGKDITFVETDHFLIWTDWPVGERGTLKELFESTYASLCAQFGLDPSNDIFLAKCPVFCFQRPGRFRKFAQKFDGFSGKSAVGYSRSIEANGHVHLVLVRQGDTPIDFDRFATTLVHEGTHAFIHRLYSNRLIPHWVNEGLAELMAERVLGARSPTGENAALLGKQYGRHDWPVLPMMQSVEPIAVHQYPLAHSLTAHLEARDRERFAAFVRALKEGKTTAEALAESYDGLTLENLERDWRQECRLGGAD